MGVPTLACAAQVDAPTFLRRTLVGLSQPAGESASSRASPQPSQVMVGRPWSVAEQPVAMSEPQPINHPADVRGGDVQHQEEHNAKWSWQSGQLTWRVSRSQRFAPAMRDHDFTRIEGADGDRP